MSDFKTIILEVDQRGVASLILNRVEKHNAINRAMIDELHKAAMEISENQNIRVVVLSARGKTFCAGGDLNWMKQQIDKDRSGKIEESKALANMLSAFNYLNKPLIAKVQSNAYGGGVGLMAVADIVIAEKNANFALTETKLGLIPATIGPYVVARMGENFARQVFFSSKSFDTDFALRCGLVTHVARREDLDDVIENEIEALLKCAPGAVSDAKNLCQQLAYKSPKEVGEMTAKALADRWEQPETKDGIEAFLAKKTAPWIR